MLVKRSRVGYIIHSECINNRRGREGEGIIIINKKDGELEQLLVGWLVGWLVILLSI